MTVVEFLIRFESIELSAYDAEADIAGVDTIGVGHLLTDYEHETGLIQIDGTSVRWRDGLTREQALALLAQDLKPREKCVYDAVKVPLTHGQFVALVSFVFNVGCRRFRTSDLLARLNEGRYDAVPVELMRYVKNRNKKGIFVTVRGLVNRRRAEIAVWNGQTPA